MRGAAEKYLLEIMVIKKYPTIYLNAPLEKIYPTIYLNAPLELLDFVLPDHSTTVMRKRKQQDFPVKFVYYGISFIREENDILAPQGT